MSYPISSTQLFFRALLAPVESIDDAAKFKMRVWYEKVDNELIRGGNYITIHDMTYDELRKLFPEHDPSSIDKLSMVLLLINHKRLEKIGALAVDPRNSSRPLPTSEIDIEALWRQQPLKDRIWWTVRYRRPYTYGLSLAKYATEMAIVAGAAYGVSKGVSRLKKWYQNRKKPELHKSA